MFVLVGDPDAGVDDASALGLVTSVVVISAAVVVLMLWLRRRTPPSVQAAVLGLCAGLLFGLAASFAKPVIKDLQADIAETAGHWRIWTLLLITPANRETQVPGQPTGTYRALAGETLR
jgi:hypothetical protein